MKGKTSFQIVFNMLVLVASAHVITGANAPTTSGMTDWKSCFT